MHNSTKRSVIKLVYNMSRLTFLITAITLTITGVISAATVKSQNMKTVKVSAFVKQAVLKDVFSQLEKTSGFTFVYPQEIGEIENVNLDANQISLYQLLMELSRSKHLRFEQENYLIAVVKSQPAQQPGKVSGRVTDEKGEFLPGASVKVIETGKLVQTGPDGTYHLELPAGNYTLEFSYLSFQTKKVTDVAIVVDKNTALNIALNPSSESLKMVTITTSYKKASVEGLLARQKNASEISNGISAEQLARTPDKNIGESLKRISGVSTIDNKFVLVRGIGERYNAAMLDGVVLPSTEAQSRNFSFDLIPSNLVDNIVVSKTVTPDMNASFGGGLIQINTKDIPNENFMSFTAGGSYNDQSTGKDFLSHKRGKYDYLGFDDGRRNYPRDLMQTNRQAAPNVELTQEEYDKKVIDQSKRFTSDNLTVYRYKAAPSQNYQFTLGRLYALDTTNTSKLGFTGAVTYRNTQNINIISKQNRSDWFVNDDNPGKAYSFNTTLGALLNVGLQLGRNRFSLRNTYTHLYDNTLVQNIGYESDNPYDWKPLNIPNRIQEADDPTYNDLLQNKLSGQHALGKVKLEWDLARTSINRAEKDMVIGTSYPTKVSSGYQYFYAYGSASEVRQIPTSRHNYKNSEAHESWNFSASTPFETGNIKSIVKAGYFGNVKKSDFDWQIAALTGDLRKIPDSLSHLPPAEMINPDKFSTDGFFYSVSPWWDGAYAGRSNTHATYLMLDTRFIPQLRLVYGVRADYYKYKELRNDYNQKGTTGFVLKKDKAWQWLPSANLTYSPIEDLNIRAAYSSSVIRPELLENSDFFRYSPYLGASFGNQGLYSTRIDSYDFKAELFPGLGEVFSIGGYYKKFDKPAELTFVQQIYTLRSADRARVYGLEFEVRKNFGVLFGDRIFKDFTIYGNYTLQRSEVVGTFNITNPAGGPDLELPSKQKRAMYGQSPYLFNAGLQYTGNHFGFNVMMNGNGRKTYIVAAMMDEIEYEKPRKQIDLQLSYKLLKNHLEMRFNAGNLLNVASTFYTNRGSYEKNPDYTVESGDISNALRLKPYSTDNYDEGDLIRFSQKFGRTYSTSLIYNFK